MKLNNSYFYTMRDEVKEEDTASGNLLVRSGMIKKNSAGIYMYLPMGLKALRNIEEIIRKEMNAIDSEEVLMPALVYEEYYEKSGRKAAFGPSVFSLKDRFNKPYILGPTHEELFALAAGYKIKSYKDLPFSLYQFQNKFRDEPRPRYGLIRVREFIMKDAYTFDKDYEGLDIAYKKMYEAYKKSFDKMGIDYRIVKADTGVMGGLLSEEFQAVTEIGEDTLVMCKECDYATNLEVAEIKYEENIPSEELKEIEKIHTPNTKTINDLIEKYNFDPKNMVKSIVYTTTKGENILAMVRSDRSINEVKLTKYLNATEIVLADETSIKEATNAEIGFAGPISIKNIKIVADNEIKNMVNFIVGANETDYHYINTNLNRDFSIDNFTDLRQVEESDKCPICGANFEFKKGIEIGNTFKLGTKYAETMDIKYLDSNNNLQPVIMGSYGIGPGRCLASIVEQSHDEYGIIWPMSVAPYKVAIVLINPDDETQSSLAEKVYQDLLAENIEVVLDNRNERPGVKFNDMDLIGIPLRITVGKKAAEGIVELKERKNSTVEEISINDIIAKIKELTNIWKN